MKGIVFVQFIEMVEQEFGLETADRIIEQSELSTNGAYTSVGTYDHTELLQLVSHLSKQENIPVPDLVRSFGKYMFKILTDAYPVFLENAAGVFSLLANVEGVIHVEVKKLYPDAELSRFRHRFMGEGSHGINIQFSKTLFRICAWTDRRLHRILFRTCQY